MSKSFLVALLTGISCIRPADEVKSIPYGSNDGKYLTVHGTRIYYEEYGQGTPLLLLHQGFGSIETMGDLIPGLSEHFRVIATDAPGHGRSEQADSISRELLAGYLSDMIDQLRLDSLYVMGWSMGGNTALLLAANRPDKVKKVVSGGSNSRRSGLTDDGLAVMEEFTIEAVIEDKDWLANYQKLNPQPDQWKIFFNDMMVMWGRETNVLHDKMGKIEIPVLIVRGDQDLIKLEHSIEMYRSLSKGQLCVLPNASHDVLSEKTDLLVMVALDFLKK